MVWSSQTAACGLGRASHWHSTQELLWTALELLYSLPEACQQPGEALHELLPVAWRLIHCDGREEITLQPLESLHWV